MSDKITVELGEAELRLLIITLGNNDSNSPENIVYRSKRILELAEYLPNKGEYANP